jgi:TrmH family RNA methyltransferase
MTLELLSQNEIKAIGKLRDAKYRRHEGLFWAEGQRILEGFLREGTELKYGVVTQKNLDLKTLFPQNITVYQLNERDVARVKSTENFPGVGGVFKIPSISDLKGNFIIALDGISDPGNLGTLIRSARWFGFKDFLIAQGGVDLFNEKVLRASMGAIAGIHYTYSKDLKKDLQSWKKKGYFLVGSDLSGQESFSFPKKKSILVLGNEAQGIHSDLLQNCDLRVRIPGSGQAESLNVAVAAGILFSKRFAQSELFQEKGLQ